MCHLMSTAGIGLNQDDDNFFGWHIGSVYVAFAHLTCYTYVVIGSQIYVTTKCCNARNNSERSARGEPIS